MSRSSPLARCRASARTEDAKRWSLALPLTILLVLLSVGLAACGGARSTPRDATARAAQADSSPATTSAAPVIGGRVTTDRDEDDAERLPNDDNNSAVRDFGRPATTADARAVSVLLARYYAAASAGRADVACRMILANVVRAMPVSYGVDGPSYMRGGKTCAQLLARLFRHERRRLAAETPRLTVRAVRLEGDHGLVLLGFGRLPEREIGVQRESATWKLAAPFDGELP